MSQSWGPGGAALNLIFTFLWRPPPVHGPRRLFPYATGSGRLVFALVFLSIALFFWYLAFAAIRTGYRYALTGTGTGMISGCFFCCFDFPIPSFQFNGCFF